MISAVATKDTCSLGGRGSANGSQTRPSGRLPWPRDIPREVGLIVPGGPGHWCSFCSNSPGGFHAFDENLPIGGIRKEYRNQ